MNQKQRELNEKLGYKTKCNEWKELKVTGDIMAIIEITGLGRSTISKAVNTGVGDIELLRTIALYYEHRRDKLPNSTNYFTAR